MLLIFYMNLVKFKKVWPAGESLTQGYVKSKVKDAIVWLTPDQLSESAGAIPTACARTHPLADKGWLSSPQVALSKASPWCWRDKPKEAKSSSLGAQRLNQ
jgi:hypothetical protein